MRRLAWLLLLLPVLASAQPEVGSYPNAATLTGSERILGDQASSYPCTSCTVNITPLQLKTYIGASMTWPSSAGIPNYTGSSSWGTSYSASNQIPNTFIPFAAPGAIGGTTPAAASFTALSATGAVTFSGLSTGTVANGICDTSAGLLITCSTSGLTVQTNGTNNSSQTTLNLESGPGTAVSNLSGGNVLIAASYTLRAVTSGTTDTIESTDCANGVNYTSTSAVAITLPEATGSFSSCNVDLLNNSAETETVTPTTSTINGASSLSLVPGTSVNITALSGNYVAAGTGVGGITHTIASGTATLGTSAIASGACASAVTVAASGVLTTDTINISFDGDPTSTVGYEPSTSGMLTIVAYPTSGDINVKVCNNTSASVTPGAVTLNWHVVR